MFRNGCAFAKMILMPYLSLWGLEEDGVEVIFVCDAPRYPKEHLFVSRLSGFARLSF
jgi:hypothetical protein